MFVNCRIQLKFVAELFDSSNIQGCPKKLEEVPVNKYTTRYRPPYEEFEVDRCILPVEESVSFPAIVGPSIFVVMDGDGVMQTSESAEESVVAGDVLFIPANVQVNIRSGSMLELYRAGVNSDLICD